MNADEKYISFLNRYFIFKKVLDVPIKDVKLAEQEEIVVEVKAKSETEKQKTKGRPRTKKLKKKLVLED